MTDGSYSWDKVFGGTAHSDEYSGGIAIDPRTGQTYCMYLWSGTVDPSMGQSTAQASMTSARDTHVDPPLYRTGLAMSCYSNSGTWLWNQRFTIYSVDNSDINIHAAGQIKIGSNGVLYISGRHDDGFDPNRTGIPLPGSGIFIAAGTLPTDTTTVPFYSWAQVSTYSSPYGYAPSSMSLNGVNVGIAGDYATGGITFGPYTITTMQFSAGYAAVFTR